MPLIMYKRKRFSESSRLTIARANQILDEYGAQGYDLTLRQLYYQFVARGLIPNSDREYKKLGSIVNDGRMAGLIDWDSIVDRTRYLRTVSSWTSPASIIGGAARGYKRDLWAEQPYRVEVWVEKDALVGVIERAVQDLRVPFLSCRGYTSQTEMWGAAQRFYDYAMNDRQVKVLHLGDHDPSGIDMSRDIEERILTFMANDYYRESSVEADEAVEWAKDHFELVRLALNWEQVQEYQPPPNPAKLTDSRGAAYVSEYGNESWELDALEPTVIGQLIEDEVSFLRDDELWDDAVKVETHERNLLVDVSRRWAEVGAFLRNGGDHVD